MNEPMSPEAEEQIRYIASMDAPGPFSGKAVAALRTALVEVDRLRAHLVAEHLATEAAETENDLLRARLDEIGETREEWGSRYKDGDVMWGFDSEADVRSGSVPGETVYCRIVGQEREVPDA